MSLRKISIFVSLIALAWPQIVHAKSVYCVTHQWPARLCAYDIIGDQITLIADLIIPYYGYGPIDVTIDSESGILFITSESNGSGGNQIILVDARTLQYIKTISLTNGERNLSGIIVDEYADRVYAVDRDTNRLYTYFWDRDNIELTLDTAMGNPVLLADIDYANGITLDDRTGTLYAAEFSYAQGLYFDTVKLYSRDDSWGLTDVIDLGFSAVDIELDTAAGYIYAGAYGDHNYLLKKNLAITDPADPDFIYATDISANIIGIAVDPESGLVYATTYRDGGAIEVWDTSNWPLEPNTPIAPADSLALIGGPAGICVPRRNIGYQQPALTVTKTDDVGVGDPNDPEYHTCVSPGDEITYTIAFNPGYDPNEFFDAVVTDRLPNETFFVSADPDTGLYDIFSHTYTWDLGDLEGWDRNYTGDPNYYLYLTVQVNPGAEPLGRITNYVEIESFGSTAAYASDREYTPVCCWGGDIIYVDQSAAGFQTGTSWEEAYRTLHPALERAAANCGSEIWVARGTYAPGTIYRDTFVLLDGVAIYGGFAGNETLRSQRNVHRNPSILTGRDVCAYVVSAQDVDESAILDGFVIQSAAAYGIYCVDADPTISNCLVRQNASSAVYCAGGSPNLTSCALEYNANNGAVILGSASFPTMDRCNIHDNAQDGIYLGSGRATITNSCIHHNGDAGIALSNPAATTLRNNTIAANSGYAISRNSGQAPTITNSILWHNNALAAQLENCSATYSCITNPNDPNGLSPGADTPDANHNISANPQFAYLLATGNLHLSYANSPSRDKGDNSPVPPDETDFDNEPRIHNEIVDIGADEASCSDDFHPYDWNADGRVNLYEYAILNHAWLSLDPNSTTDPNLAVNWDPRADLDNDDQIHLPDLALLVQDWPWQACWRTNNDITWTTMTLRESPGQLDTDQPLNTTTYTRWLNLRPPYTPTLLQQIWQLEDLITWAADLYVTDEQVRQTIPEPEYKTFLDQLYNSLKFLRLQHYLETTNTNPATLPEDFQP